MTSDHDEDEPVKDAEYYLRQTLADLQASANASLASKKLATRDHGRLQVGLHKIETNSSTVLQFLSEAMVLYPEMRSFVFSALTEMLAGAFHIGHHAEPSLETTRFLNTLRSSKARRARKANSGKDKRFDIVRQIIEAGGDDSTPSHIILTRVNAALAREGLGKISAKTLGRYKDELRKEGQGHIDIVSMFLRTD